MCPHGGEVLRGEELLKLLLLLLLEEELLLLLGQQGRPATRGNTRGNYVSHGGNDIKAQGNDIMHEEMR